MIGNKKIFKGFLLLSAFCLTSSSAQAVCTRSLIKETFEEYLKRERLLPVRMNREGLSAFAQECLKDVQAAEERSVYEALKTIKERHEEDEFLELYTLLKQPSKPYFNGKILKNLAALDPKVRNKAVNFIVTDIEEGRAGYLYLKHFYGLSASSLDHLFDLLQNTLNPHHGLFGAAVVEQIVHQPEEKWDTFVKITQRFMSVSGLEKKVFMSNLMDILNHFNPEEWEGYLQDYKKKIDALDSKQRIRAFNKEFIKVKARS